MANQIQINPNGGAVSWSITIDRQMVALYRALLLGANSTAVERWNDQRTADGVPDSFTISLPVSQLSGCILWWQAIVTDPTNNGGAYTGTVQIHQDGAVLGSVQAQGSVPAGAGKMDLFADELTITV